MAKENLNNVFSLDDKICRQTGITAKWINDTKFAVYGYNHITSYTADKPTALANSGEINIYLLQTAFIFDEPVLRSLVAEASSIFKSVQEVPTNARSEFLKLSRTYRSTIRACLEKLRESLATDDVDGNESNVDSNKRTMVENNITIFYSVECVWHLCEILLIDRLPSKVVVPQLLEWIRFHFPAYERRAAELLFADNNDLEKLHIEILPVVRGLITQGLVEEACSLLHTHPSADSAAFQMAHELLKAMPVYDIYGGLSVQAFKTQWQRWVTNTKSKVAMGFLNAVPELEDIIKLVCGNQLTWIEHARASSTCWYKFFPGYLFYAEPACKHSELGTHAETWLRQWTEAKGVNATALKHLDRVLFKVMENDMHQVIHDCQQMCDNKWFVTHLTDLLYHCGQLEIIGDQRINVAAAVRESLLFDFGALLMSRSSLWLIGIDYLEHSSSEGLGAIELLLPRIAVANERQAQKIISVAKAKGLPDVEQEICRVQAMKSLQNERMGNALEWAIRSRDSIFVTSIADKFLNHYSKSGRMLCPDLLGNVGTKMFISPRLVFLVKYSDFHEYYKSREFPQAAELLVNLLNSKITPDNFWPSLLADAIPLLESKEPQFSSMGTYTILHHLENQLVPLIEKRKLLLASGKITSLELLNDCRVEEINETVRLIRVACARNLARVLIIENTVMI